MINKTFNKTFQLLHANKIYVYLHVSCFYYTDFFSQKNSKLHTFILYTLYNIYMHVCTISLYKSFLFTIGLKFFRAIPVTSIWKENIKFICSSFRNGQKTQAFGKLFNMFHLLIKV